jgi:hypothetical protein
MFRQRDSTDCFSVSRSLRRRVLIELPTLVLLSSTLLLQFVHRLAWVNLLLALSGLSLFSARRSAT